MWLARKPYENYNSLMKRFAAVLSLMVAAGAFRPVMRLECAPAKDCAPRAVHDCCHREAPAPKSAAVQLCCLSPEPRTIAPVAAAPVAEFSVVSMVSADVVLPLSVSSLSFPSAFHAPPGASSSEGFSTASSLRGPPALA
jgi:hypothetical protein